LVVDVLEKWKNKLKGWTQGSPLQANDLDYIISHWTRSLVKLWDKRTLEFLGYSSNPKIQVSDFNIQNREVKIWENLEFSFEISRGEPCINPINLIIDYKIYFISKNWKLLPKVFKIKKCRGIPCGYPEIFNITKKHKFKIMSTKALYIWEHFVEIIINGRSFWKENFYLRS
jgi:hypothetical protein